MWAKMWKSVISTLREIRGLNKVDCTVTTPSDTSAANEPVRRYTSTQLAREMKDIHLPNIYSRLGAVEAQNRIILGVMTALLITLLPIAIQAL